MSPIRKLYQSELRRIRKQGIKVSSSRGFFNTMCKVRGYPGSGYYEPPNIIHIQPSIKTISYRLRILLHEEGRWRDNKGGHQFLREFRAEKYLIQRAIELNNKLLTRQIVDIIAHWLELKNHKDFHVYYCAASKLVKTKLWDKLCQN